jgi:NMD protein affecting ribosome stability and mRNA decay
MRAQYYEGTLQLRNPTEQVLNYAENAIRESNIHIAKMTKLPNGYDLQLSSQKFLTNLGNKLKQKFGGELVISRKETGFNKHGKAQFRINVLFRQYAYKKNSFVIYRGEEYKIIALEHKVRIKSLENGKSITVGYDEIHEIK